MTIGSRKAKFYRKGSRPVGAEYDANLIVVSVDQELYERVQTAAERDGLSVNDFTMLALSNYLGGPFGTLQPR